MAERKFFGFITKEIGLGSVAVFVGQLALGIVYVAQDHQTIRDVAVKIDRMDATQSKMALELPLQNRDIAEHGRRLANIDGVLSNLSDRVGIVERTNAGFSADLRNILDRLTIARVTK